MAYGEAVNTAVKEAGVRLDLVGCHGQTIYHQGFAAVYLRQKIASTWQLGDGSWIAAATGAPVVSDFRHADMAAGGLGAPLVPFFDFLAYRHRTRQRVALNLGGIANVTVIPASARAEQVVAFDTGPGNMVIDACVEALMQGRRKYDAEGRLAANGKADESVLRELLRNQYFKLPPPKSAGREQFGAEFARALLKRMAQARAEDVIATATALTAASVATAIVRSAPLPRGAKGDVIASGGGTRNRTLMRMLAERLYLLGYKLTTTDAFGAAVAGEGGGGIRAARVRDMAPASGEPAERDRGDPRGDPGQDQLCVGLFLLPDLHCC